MHTYLPFFRFPCFKSVKINTKCEILLSYYSNKKSENDTEQSIANIKFG